MKKLLLIMSILLASLLGFSQATPVEALRIANNTTAMGKNLSVGKLVWDINAALLYVVKYPVHTDSTLLLSAWRFSPISSADDQGLTWDGDNGHIEIDNGTDADIGMFPIDSQNYGFVKGSNNLGATYYLNGSGNWTVPPVDDADADATNEGSLTVEAGGVNDTEIHSNTSGSADIIVEGSGVITITENVGTNTITIGTSAEANRTAMNETFEEDNTPTGIYVLTNTPIGDFIVSFNGVQLKESVYGLVTKTVTVTIPTLEYDEIIIHYYY